MFDTQPKNLELGEFIAAVKVKRKELDGRETYGKWKRYICESHRTGASVTQTANFIVTMAKDSER